MFLFSFSVKAQENSTDYYQLTEEEIEYPKIVRYVLLDKNGKKVSNDDSNVILFVIYGEQFKYLPEKHHRDTLAAAKLEMIEFSTIEQLKRAEYREHKKRTEQAGIELPPPPKHYNIKVYIVKKLSNENAARYEVDWLYTIQ